MSELLSNAATIGVAHDGLICAGMLWILAVLGWLFRWSWGTWILLGVACAAAGEFAGSGQHLTPANARRLTLFGAIIVVGAQYMANRESERATRTLARKINKNLDTTTQSLSNTEKSIARLDEVTKMLTGADSIVYIHVDIDFSGDYRMIGRFEGSYPIPVVAIRILDSTWHGDDLWKAPLVYEETLTHVTRIVN